MDVSGWLKRHSPATAVVVAGVLGIAGLLWWTGHAGVFDKHPGQIVEWFRTYWKLAYLAWAVIVTVGLWIATSLSFPKGHGAEQAAASWGFVERPPRPLLKHHRTPKGCGQALRARKYEH